MRVRDGISVALVGDPTRRRAILPSVGVVMAVLLAVGVSGEVVDAYLWVFASLTGVIPLVGGLRADGILSSFVATAPCVGILGYTAFVATGGPLYPFRLIGIWLGVTTILVLAAYFMGVGSRKALPARSDSVVTSR